MKRLFDEEFTLDDIKRNIKKLQKEKDLNNYIITALVIVSILAIVITMIVAVVKLTRKYDEDIFEDFEDEDEEEFYAQDEDFAE